MTTCQIPAQNATATGFHPNVPPTACMPNIKADQLNRISQISLMLRNFISSCDRVLCDLSSAYNTEALDASTSNYSIIGWFISNASYQKNHHVASQVDRLQCEAQQINSMVCNSGLFSNYPMFCQPLSTDFSGWTIRQSENAEHNVLADMVTSSAYSSMASTNTLSQISMTSARVNAVRQQAAQMLQMLYTVGMQSGGAAFNAMPVYAVPDL